MNVLQNSSCSAWNTWIAGFEVSSKEMPRPSKASLQVPSVRVFRSPLDFPNSLVCILEEAVSRGYKLIISWMRCSHITNYKVWKVTFCVINKMIKGQKRKKFVMVLIISDNHLIYLHSSTSGVLMRTCHGLRIRSLIFLLYTMIK